MQNLSLFESNSQLFTVDDRLSFNFRDHNNSNLATFSSLTETKSYTPITGCVLEHILTTTDLTNHEKLYYLLADSLALINKNESHHRSCALPSEDWATYLGCSRSLIFTMQKSLKKKRYFIINKGWDEIGRNKRNLIIPTLPASVFNHLNKKFPDRTGDHAPYNPLTECKRAYLDRTKLFIKLNYDLLKIITSNEYLNPGQKIIWLGFYTRCYKNYMFQDGKDSSFSFISSYQELASIYSCNTKYLSKSIRALEEINFIKTQNFYIRKKYNNNDDSYKNSCGVDNNYYKTQERQDQSLWKITLSLPNDCILELEKVKDRSNLKLDDIKVTATDNTIDSNLVEDYLMLGGIKFNLSLEQASLLKSVINDDVDTTSLLSTAYIDSVIEELDKSDDTDSSDAFSKPSLSLETFDNKEEKSDGIKSDPHVSKSGLLLNKDLLLKIKDLKSNLRLKPKVLFNEFLKRFRKKDDGNIEKRKKIEKEFNICSELIREKLKILPKDKADKARKFAYSLVSKKLATGYAASLSKNELAKQLIHHAATWKPTKLGSISREKEIDTALSVAWKAIVGGTWQVPLELAKAEILHYEFKAHRRKYQESGVLSHEVKSLESDVNNLLGSWCDLVGKITEGAKAGDERMESGGDRNNKPIDVMQDEYRRERYLGTGVYTNESLGLKFSKLDILTTSDIFNIHPLNKEMLISNDYRLGKAVEECGNYELEQEMCHRVSQQNSPLYCGISEAGNNVNYQFDYDDLEIQQRNIHSFDLSHTPEEQKYLRVIPSDNDDSIKLETINGKEYFVKLKELEMNDQGELVMTLRSVAKELFYIKVQESTSNYCTLGTTNRLAIKDFNECNKNLTTLEQKSFNRGFMQINTVLSDIFTNLQRKTE